MKHISSLLVCAAISGLTLVVTAGCISTPPRTVVVYGPVPPPVMVVETSPAVVIVAPSPFYYWGPRPVYPRWHSYGDFERHNNHREPVRSRH